MSSNLLAFLFDLFDKLNIVSFLNENNIHVKSKNHIIIHPYWNIYINHKPYLPYDTLLFTIKLDDNNSNLISVYQNSYSYFIRGEKFIKLSNEAWASQNRINANPNWRNFTNQLVTWTNVTPSGNNQNKLIYMYTDEVNNLNNSLHILNNSQSKYILMSHTSDHSINPRFQRIINNSNVHRWYGINCDMNQLERNNKVIPIPIGIENSMYLQYSPGNGYMAEWNRVIYELGTGEIVKTGDIFFNFSMHTNRAAREDCFNKLKNYIEWIPMMPYLTFIRLFARYKFCICPVGNGLDTHRVWDCLYMRVIPIMLRNKYSEYWEHKIPCILLNDWTDLVNIITDMDKMMEFMEQQWTEENIYKMKYWNFAYYENIIRDDFATI